MRWWPRSIRWQMLAGLVLLETLSITLFYVLLTRQQTQRISTRGPSWIVYEANLMAAEASAALDEQKPALVAMAVHLTGESPTVAAAKITDANGNVEFVGSGSVSDAALTPMELAQMAQVHGQSVHVFQLLSGSWEGVRAIYTGGRLHGYAWVAFNRSLSSEQLAGIQRDTVVFGVIWVAASVLLVWLMARSIAGPLAVLHRGTRSLMASPESGIGLPLPVTVHNEIGDVIETFNRMAASLAEQRAGLNDTLSLLDSMLANAPVGLAFFDRQCRLVRVNQVFDDITGLKARIHLGKTLPEMLPPQTAQVMEDMILRVFESEEPVRNLEISGHGGGTEKSKGYDRPWTWLVSAYPVRPTAEQVRWVGVIILDASERKRSEEALRKTEKLAVTGRLAASIAHEINNPLEAVTNLHFLLRNFGNLDEASLNYLTMAEFEVRRIAEITQQTLRFYRQSTSAGRAKLSEVIDSVLGLYQGRLNGSNIHVDRHYDPELDLFCFAGEIRQVFANLIGNAVDANVNGGTIEIRARRSRNWKNPEQCGIRFVVADSGSGMEPIVRARAFEAFFTTKDVTGTGLGLWISQEIVLKHHGFIHLKSRTSADSSKPGTVFELFIPDDPGLAAEEKQFVEAAV